MKNDSKKLKKLSLKRETLTNLTNLTNKELEHVAGGGSVPFSYNYSCGGGCHGPARQ